MQQSKIIFLIKQKVITVDAADIAGTNKYNKLTCTMACQEPSSELLSQKSKIDSAGNISIEAI